MARTRVAVDPDILAAQQAIKEEREARRLAEADNWRQAVLEPRIAVVYAETRRRAATLIAEVGGDKHAVDWKAHTTWESAALRACYYDAPTTGYKSLVDLRVLTEITPLFPAPSPVEPATGPQSDPEFADPEFYEQPELAMA